MNSKFDARNNNPKSRVAPDLVRITRKSELEYLSDMIPQLRVMALGLEAKNLAHILEMAMMEASLQLDIENFHNNLIDDDDVQKKPRNASTA